MISDFTEQYFGRNKNCVNAKFEILLYQPYTAMGSPILNFWYYYSDVEILNVRVGKRLGAKPWKFAVCQLMGSFSIWNRAPSASWIFSDNLLKEDNLANLNSHFKSVCCRGENFKMGKLIPLYTNSLEKCLF